MKRLLLGAVMLLNILTSAAQSTLQERLGYSKDTKLLIIHADDLGISYSENKASTHAMENGSVNSASIMVPCPWFPEIASYAQAHPKGDFGLHLTLTSEWKYFKFGPTAADSSVPTLINKRGFLYESVDSVLQSAKPDEVESELRAQIERARQFGIDVTHLDSHMGTLFAKMEFLSIMMKLGQEYKVPILLSKQITRFIPPTLVGPNEIVLDSIYIASPPDFKNGMEKYYTGVLKDVKPGVSIILLHAAYDDREMQGITIDHPDYGAAWRQADFNFFSSEKCKRLIANNKIQLVTWREIRDKLLR